MEYLSFDIECCDGRHICEFGYVRFDEAFHVIEKECLLINPERRITLSGKRSRGDMKLHFSDEEYYAAPIFPKYYDRIKALLNAPDTRIVGFSLQNDCGFLKTACERYDLPQLKFRYVDFQWLYRGYTGAKQDVSVGGFAEELHIEGIAFHKSDDDAYAVVLGLKKIAETEGCDLPTVLDLMVEKRKEYDQKIAREKAQRRFKKIVEGNKKMQNGFLRNFSQKQPINKEATNEIFSGKWVCVGSSYQTTHFTEFVSLVKLLADNGARYTPKTSGCSVFVTYDTESDARYESAKIANRGGKEILFLSLQEALASLGATEEILLNEDLVIAFYEQTPEIREVVEAKGGATIGELVKTGQKKKRRRRGGKGRKKPQNKTGEQTPQAKKE